MASVPKLIKSPFFLPAIVLLVAGIAYIFLSGLFNAGQELKLSSEVQAKEVANASRFGGRVVDILVEEGDTVKKDDLLVVFDGLDLKTKLADAEATLQQVMAKQQLLKKGADPHELSQANASVQQSKEQLNLLKKGSTPALIRQAKSKHDIALSQAKQANDNLKQAEILFEKGIIAKQQYELAKEKAAMANSQTTIAEAALKQVQDGRPAEEKKAASAQLKAASARYQQLLQGAKPEQVQIADASIQKAQNAVDALKQQLKELELRAPVSGHISIVSVNSGDLVQPGQPVVNILNTENLWADIFVPESKLALIELQKQVTVTAKAFQDAVFTGKVIAINPKSEFVPHSGGNTSAEESAFRVKVILDKLSTNSGKILYPGMKINITAK
ncbi:MAG: HlyD family efflux transporter periplasmic adaptor subunit [Cyanobacteria bacterium P01_H01_bin.74]